MVDNVVAANFLMHLFFALILGNINALENTR